MALTFIDTHYISKRWPCETGLNTTKQPLTMQERMFKFASNVARLIGIDFNAHKVDINIAPDGSIKLIELTARLSGGFHCQYASPLAFGSNDILKSAEQPVPVKKQAKYNLIRWALTGRDDFGLNTSCWQRGHITLNPEFFARDSLFFSTHNGGDAEEFFFIQDTPINHLAPVSAMVSASHGS
ncbi:MAG: hypothetical protein ACUVQ2_04420 [Dissulfurimicrobium sp.]|uniref:hypothetical protein n=1 Tax=Dissulfurimicrobium sp. TaxID=2022436 RepID=UPI004049CE12